MDRRRPRSPTAYGITRGSLFCATPTTREDFSMTFGLLSYCTANLGDDMQSIAARRFLPRVDCYVDREALDAPDAPHDQRLALIMNGWFCHRPDKWPPS